MPLALVITELDVGGAEKALVSLATGLDRRRWSPSVIALGPEGPLAGPLREAGVPVECLGVSPRRPFRGLAALGGALRRARPELVQSFLFHANVAARLAVAASWPPWASGKPWVVGGHRVAERRKGWHRVLERRTALLGAGAVCVSEGVRRFAEGVGGWPADRLTVIPNAVDVSPFDQSEGTPVVPGLDGLPAGAFVVLYLGRLDVQKGLPTLIEAAGLVAATGPGESLHLLMAGDGPERPALEAEVASRPGLAGRVHWLGRRSDVPALLRAADLLVLPSLWEGMPNAVLEAMAARRPVVATAVEGTEDVVVPGETGWLVPPGDAQALAEALADAGSDRDRLRRFGGAGRARVEAEFSPSRTLAAYERLWAGLLGYEAPDPLPPPPVTA